MLELVQTRLGPQVGTELILASSSRIAYRNGNAVFADFERNRDVTTFEKHPRPQIYRLSRTIGLSLELISSDIHDGAPICVAVHDPRPAMKIPRWQVSNGAVSSINGGRCGLQSVV